MDTHKALDKAVQLAEIASDWHLDEVEIDGEMVSIYDLRDEFRAALAALEQAPHASVDDNRLIAWYKEVFGEYPADGILAFIREAMRRAALEQAPALERVPDGEYFNGALIVRDGDIGLIVDASLDHYQWLSSMVEGGLPEGWKLMRPASARGQEDSNRG